MLEASFFFLLVCKNLNINVVVVTKQSTRQAAGEGKKPVTVEGKMGQVSEFADTWAGKTSHRAKYTALALT